MSSVRVSYLGSMKVNMFTLFAILSSVEPDNVQLITVSQRRAMQVYKAVP